MREQELTWSHVLSVWWLVQWRVLLGALVLGALAGGVAGIVCGILGYGDKAALAGSYAGFIASILWLPVVIRMALGKKYSNFRIALLHRDQ